jgi:hypothetical protein
MRRVFYHCATRTQPSTLDAEDPFTLAFTVTMIDKVEETNMTSLLLLRLLVQLPVKGKVRPQCGPLTISPDKQ